MTLRLELALFKHKGLTRADVHKITENLREEIKELKQDIDKARIDVSFWKSELKKRAPKKKCTRCKVEIDLWPFNTQQGYYIKGNRVTHVVCQKEGDNDKSS